MPLIKVFKVHLSAAWSFRQTETVSTTVRAHTGNLSVGRAWAWQWEEECGIGTVFAYLAHIEREPETERLKESEREREMTVDAMTD